MPPDRRGRIRVGGAATAVRPRRRLPDATPSGGRLAGLALAALGVVYGDIGTSPLYAFKACFDPEYGLTPSASSVYGVLSLIVWSLILIVCVKYIGFVLRLDNRGEGGILALLALILQTHRGAEDASRRAVFVALGLFGAALLYGDGVITPAISVLSAVEGLEVAAPAFRHSIVPLTALILFLLFFFQRHGTARMGAIFGPAMILWFLTIGILGGMEIARAPAILLALNPWWAIAFFVEQGLTAALVLGAVVLAVTGAEALYADLGHFGRRPITLAWFAVVFPALLLNYFGQGALLLRDPSAVQNPFYRLAPPALLYPLLGIATIATIIASQALISGAFSLTHQAVQLRYSPRVSIVHTSRAEAGQIYIPEVNLALMLGCLLLVVGFRSASALGAAYGVAVTGTMAITTILLWTIARHRWKWSALRAGALAGAFLVIDLAFLAANLVKVQHGGWVPLVMAAAIFLLMTTWRRGMMLLNTILSRGAIPLHEFFEEVQRRKPPRVSGTAVFLTPNIEGTPPLLLHHLRHNKVLHEELILLTVVTEEVPEVPEGERFVTERLPAGLFRVRAFYGFMEKPDIEEIVDACCRDGLIADQEDVTYYLGRARLLPTGRSPMMRWRKRLFSFMSRNASSSVDFFGIPPNRVVELGARIEF